MSTLIRIIGLLALPFGAAANEAAVLALLKPVAEATVRGDFTAGIEIMYEPVANDLGGKQKLVEAVATVKVLLEEQKMRIVKSEFTPPFRFVNGKQRRYVPVPTLTEIDSPKGTVRAHGFQFGVEVAPGKWQFLDGARVNQAVLKKYFPDFPADEKLPERKQETVPKRN
jgi:hypothetical protein